MGPQNSEGGGQIPSPERPPSPAPSPTIQDSQTRSATMHRPPTGNRQPPWPEPVDGKLLLEELARLLRRFLVLPKWGAETLALRTLHSYAFQLRNVSTYLGIESPEKQCGKTTLLTVLSELVHRPEVAANISSPAFFRVIEETQPTLLIDEADTFLQGNDQLRGILNSGYSRKTAYVVRVASQESEAKDPSSDTKGSRLVRFSCWCPKAIAAIGRLPETLADRCIVIRMQRKTATEQCERLRNLDATVLRQQCARFVLDHAQNIAEAQPKIPSDLPDRAADIWEPLLAPGGRQLAGLGSAGGDGANLQRPAEQSHRFAPAGYLRFVQEAGSRPHVYPDHGRAPERVDRQTLGRNEEWETNQRPMAGATVATLSNPDQDNAHRRDAGQGVFRGGFPRTVSALYSPICGGGVARRIDRRR